MCLLPRGFFWFFCCLCLALYRAQVTLCFTLFTICSLKHPLTREASSLSGADIRTVNMIALTSGVLHTKFWIVDKKHIYIGSANMDWRSLTQVHTQ